jgi:hypothetical protein
VLAGVVDVRIVAAVDGLADFSREARARISGCNEYVDDGWASRVDFRDCIAVIGRRRTFGELLLCHPK